MSLQTDTQKTRDKKKEGKIVSFWSCFDLFHSFDGGSRAENLKLIGVKWKNAFFAAPKEKCCRDIVLTNRWNNSQLHEESLNSACRNCSKGPRLLSGAGRHRKRAKHVSYRRHHIHDRHAQEQSIVDRAPLGFGRHYFHDDPRRTTQRQESGKHGHDRQDFFFGGIKPEGVLD
jgi:hypothetical protein